MFPIGSQAPQDSGPAKGADFVPILDALPDAVLVHDARDGRILAVNQACLDMFRGVPDHFMGLGAKDLSEGGDGFGPDEANAWAQAAREKGGAEFQWRSRRLDGSLFWSEVRLKTLQDGRIVALVRDITDRTQAEEAVVWAEQKFERLFRFNPANILLTTFPEGRVVEVNETFLATCGFTRDEVVGRSSEPFWMDPEVRDTYLDLLSRHRVEGLETRFKVKSGETRIGRLAGELVDLPGGLHVLTVIEDITEQRASEARLLRVSRLYAALSQVNQGLTRSRTEAQAFDRLCRGLVEGGGFWAAWAAEPDPATGRFRPLASCGGYATWWEELTVYATGDRPQGQGTMGHAFREGRPVIANDFERDPMTAPWRDQGRIREFRAAASFPLRRGDGKVFGVICIYAKEAGYFGDQEIALIASICEDLTFVLEDLAKEARRRELETLLAQTQKMESLGNLAGGVAHDLNNVLGAILGLASIEAERAQEGTPQKRSMDTIVKACTRGRDVIHGLLCFARRDLGTLCPVNLNSLAEELLGLLGRTTLQRIRCETDLDPDLRCVEGDPSALSSALMNLCLNAVDAMPRGGRLVLATRGGADGSVEVEVRDDGEGMTEEVLRRATEPFFTTKPAGRGTGLGLAMVYGTVQAHRGTLDIRSRPGSGTRVLLTFPGTDARPEAPRSEGPMAPSRPLRILLVDDDPVLRESVGDVLAWQGHAVESASGGEEALARLAQGPAFDLVILDMNMPGMSGGETLPRILELRPDQRILLSSGYTDADLQTLLQAYPTVQLLPKPFTTRELARRIREPEG